MGKRREQRTELALPVRIWGMDTDGRVFSEDICTVDVTPVGARLAGVTTPLHVGSVIGIQHGNSKARFRVVWVGAPGTARNGQIGVHLTETGKYIWGRPLQRIMGDVRRHTPTPVPPLLDEEAAESSIDRQACHPLTLRRRKSFTATI